MACNAKQASNQTNVLINLWASKKHKLHRDDHLLSVYRRTVAHAAHADRDEHKSTLCTKTLKLEYFWFTSLVNLEDLKKVSLFTIYCYCYPEHCKFMNLEENYNITYNACSNRHFM